MSLSSSPVCGCGALPQPGRARPARRTHGPPLGRPWSRRRLSACGWPARSCQRAGQKYRRRPRLTAGVSRDAPHDSQAAAERGCRWPLPCRAGAGITNPRIPERVIPRPVGLIAVLEVADCRLRPLSGFGLVTVGGLQLAAKPRAPASHTMTTAFGDRDQGTGRELPPPDRREKFQRKGVYFPKPCPRYLRLLFYRANYLGCAAKREDLQA